MFNKKIDDFANQGLEISFKLIETKFILGLVYYEC